MNTMTIRIPNSADIRNIAVVMRQLKGVSEVKIHREKKIEPIPGLPYTAEDRLASIAKSEEELRMGLGISSDQLEREIAAW